MIQNTVDKWIAKIIWHSTRWCSYNITG